MKAQLWAFAMERGRVLERRWSGTRNAADHHAQALANEHGCAIEYIEESRLTGWTGHPSQDIPEGYIVDSDDMTPAGFEEPGE